MPTEVREFCSVFKPRIAAAITVSAVAGVAATPGPQPRAGAVLVLAAAVFLASASAGAFNQYMERELDRRMSRTRRRPFASGRYVAGPVWMAGILLLLAVAVAAAALATNWAAAAHVFLGAFVYGVVYTIWLKPRTILNIVVGGLAGSFAVLAGAAAADPGLALPPVILAVVLFLWTPPHFWSLAMAVREDYAAAGIPMLPVVCGDVVAARTILAHTTGLVALSLVPFWFGLGLVYLAGAAVGGALFLAASIRLARAPGPATAKANFQASLLQLSLLLLGAIADGWLPG